MAGPYKNQLTQGQRVGDQPEVGFTVSQNVYAATPTFTDGGGKLAISSIPIGSVAYASLGTNTTDVAGQFWLTDIFIPYRRIITKIGVLQGGTATTDNILVAIWNAAGVLRATSALAGSVLSGANTFQELALVLDGAGNTISSLQIGGPEQYFIGVQGNGTTAGAIRTVAASTYPDVMSTTLAGTFGTVPTTLTQLSTFTANNAPIVYVK